MRCHVHVHPAVDDLAREAVLLTMPILRLMLGRLYARARSRQHMRMHAAEPAARTSDLIGAGALNPTLMLSDATRLCARRVRAKPRVVGYAAHSGWRATKVPRRTR